jgi:beta-1,4-N-acetylglucosaminyltransferase
MAKDSEHFFTLQIANLDYEPKFSNYFRFNEKIEKLFGESDLIICHAGAGTVYGLLEIGKPIVVVPNSKLKDNHQVDICKFIENEGYGLVAWSLDKLSQNIELAVKMKFKVYSNNGSNLIKEISQILRN